MLPENESAAILGRILLEEQFRSGVVFDAFADVLCERHALILRAMGVCEANSEPIDVVTISDALRRNGTLDKVGGIAVLAELVDSWPEGAADIGSGTTKNGED